MKEIPQMAFDCGDRAAAWVCKVMGKENLRLNHSAHTLQKRSSHKVIKDWPTQVQLHDEVSHCHSFAFSYNYINIVINLLHLQKYTLKFIEI